MNNYINIKQGTTLLLRLSSDVIDFEHTEFAGGYRNLKGHKGTFQIDRYSNHINIIIPADETKLLQTTVYEADIMITNKGITSCIATFQFNIDESNL